MLDLDKFAEEFSETCRQIKSEIDELIENIKASKQEKTELIEPG